MLRRTFLRVVLVIVLGLQAIPAQTVLAADKPQILLVCQFGSVKSAIARELLIRRAASRGIALHAWSRGITPEEHLSPTLSVQLRAEQIDPTRQPLTALTSDDLKAADLVIAFDPLPFAIPEGRLLNWSDVPSMNSSYDAARKVLDPRIDALLDRLQQMR
jgi:hypothetical protein